MNSERPFILCFLTNNDIGFYSAGLDCKIKAILTIFDDFYDLKVVKIAQKLAIFTIFKS